MSYHLSVEIPKVPYNERIYDTTIMINEMEYQQIVESKFLPDKFFDSAMEYINKMHKDVELSSLLFGIRENGGQITYLTHICDE